MVVGGAMVIVGVFFAIARTSVAARGERASLRVIDVAVEWRGEGERAKTVMYEVLDGRHKGLRTMSLVGRTWAQHSVGQKTEGMIDPDTQAVLSDADHRFRLAQAIWIACVGVIVAVAAFFWPGS